MANETNLIEPMQPYQVDLDDLLRWLDTHPLPPYTIIGGNGNDSSADAEPDNERKRFYDEEEIR